MIKPKQNLIGMRFGRLEIISQAEDEISKNGRHYIRWVCKCECGNIKEIREGNLKSGNVKSCGCLRREGEKHKKYNRFDISGEYGIGWTSNTNEEFYFDLDDYEKIKNICWCRHNSKKDNYYRLEGYNGEKVVIFSSVIGCKNHDHIDRNPFNNQKSNLREATSTTNARNRSVCSNNTSSVTGVIFNKKAQKWTARIGKDNKRIHLGYFYNFDDAVKARLLAEKEYYGDFAPQKHLYKDYEIIA